MKSKINSIFNSITYRFGSCIVDPGDDWSEFNGISYVLLTHCHFDHIYGLNRIIELNPAAKVLTNQYGAKMLSDSRLNMSYYNATPFLLQHPDKVNIVDEGVEITIGTDIITPIFTPGHNPSCITWFTSKAVFTGDAYIPGVKTVTTLPGGDKHLAIDSIARIQALAQKKTIYPGHKV